MAIAEDAIDNYLLWELCKQKGIQNMVMEGSAEEGKLKEIVEKVEIEYRENQYGLEEKKKKLRDLDSNPDYRLEVFENCSWRKETVKIEDLGTTLPRAGDLPPGIIAGKLSNAIEFVQQADPDEYQSVKYIMRLKQVPEVLNEFYPWILTPGKRKSKRDRMNRVHGEKDWGIKDTWGMINDGNHRTIARILASDSKEIKCYVGHRRES